VRIELERGSVDIEAPHVEGRSFAVAAAGFEVRVVGTHFSVERLPLAVQVRVTRGEVEVAGPDGSTRRVRAGESWAAQLGQSASVTSPPSPPPAAPAIDPSPPMAPAPVVAPSVPVETAKSLFEDAQGARADGRPADAARALDKLRRTYRTDPRAGLSAFELGRLRLDALSDPRGAEEALRDAVALAPTSPFREDAEARIVQARARMGDRSGCAAARDTYLLRYPRGVYRNAVGVYCTGQ
jgi:hypothetical protein